MPVDGVLLDTTIQLGRIVYGPEETTRIGKELHDKAEVYTTSFVFREFLNTIIADLKFAHTQASEALEPDEDGRAFLAELPRFFATGKNFSPRSIQRLHLITSVLLEGFTQTRVPKEKILMRLEWVASRWIRDFFRYSDTDRKEHAIKCLKALDDGPGDLERMRNARPFPEHPKFPTVVVAFLEKRRDLVERVEAEMGKKKKNGKYMWPKAKGRDDKLLKVLQWLKNKDGSFDFHAKLLVYKGWNWALGDMLIALEAPEDIAIYSTDRAFVVLTRALGKPLHQGYRAPT